MTTSSNSIPVRSSQTSAKPTSLDILSLSLGHLCADERARLVNAILSNPETAALTKLGLRVANPAQQTASALVFAASSGHRKGWWNARNLVTGACASFAMLAIFSFSGRPAQTIEPGLVAMNQVQNSDHFGTSGSFEGLAAVSRQESVDRFGNGGFEAE